MKKLIFAFSLLLLTCFSATAIISDSTESTPSINSNTTSTNVSTYSSAADDYYTIGGGYLSTGIEGYIDDFYSTNLQNTSSMVYNSTSYYHSTYNTTYIYHYMYSNTLHIYEKVGNTIYTTLQKVENGERWARGNSSGNQEVQFIIVEQPKLVITGVNENGGVTKHDVVVQYYYQDVLTSSKVHRGTEGESTYVNSYISGLYYNFTIDCLAPIARLSNYSTGGRVDFAGTYNYDLKITWDDATTATLNGNTYNSGDIISAEGTYSLFLQDEAGNITQEYFYIDKTPPTFFIDGVSISDFSQTHYFNHDITINWLEDNCTAKLTGYSGTYTSGTTITNEGTYAFTLTDANGNATETFNFVIDKTAPYTQIDRLLSTYPTNHTIPIIYRTNSIKINSDGSLDNTTYYSFSSEANALSYAYARELALTTFVSSYTGGDIYYMGNLLTIYDPQNVKVGSSYYIYYLEHKNPYVFFDESLKNAALEYNVNNTITKQVFSYSINDAYPGSAIANDSFVFAADSIEINNSFYEFYIKETPSSWSTAVTSIYEVNGVTMTASQLLASFNSVQTNQSVTFMIKESDLAGNFIYYSITIDKETPSFYVNNPDINTNINNANQFYITDPMYININEINSKYALLFYSTDNSTWYVATDNQFFIETDGIYYFYAQDRSGNKSSTKIISLSTKEIEITTSQRTENNLLIGIDITISNVVSPNSIDYLTVTFTDRDSYTTLLTVDANNQTISTKNLSYYFNQSGKYVIQIQDIHNRITTIEFEMDKDSPYGVLYQIPSSGSDIEVLPGANVVSSSSHYLVWYNEDLVAYWTLNGVTITYRNGTIISTEGIHTITLKDEADGTETIFIFEIDKTPPTITIQEFNNGNWYQILNNSTTSNIIRFTWTEDNITTTNGYVKEMELTGNIYMNITHTYTFTDRAGNSTTVSITIDIVPPTIQLYCKGVLIESGSIVNSTVYATWSDYGATATLNGISYTKNSNIYTGNNYVLTLTDTYGNSTSVTFTIDKESPTVDINTEASITNQDVVFTWYDNNLTFSVNGKSISTSDLSYTITLEGSYTVIFYNIAGNSISFTFEIDKTPPTITATTLSNNTITDYQITNETVKITWSEYGATAKLNGTSYTKNNSIATTGTYTLILTDTAGNSSSITFTINKDKPNGQLIGVDNEGHTNQLVLFVFSSTDTATLNGTSYLSGDSIEAEGYYTIILTGENQETNIYTFTIDKSPVSLTFNHIFSDMTNSNVTISWNDYNCSAFLNGSTYSRGTTISAEGSYYFYIVDQAGNITEYSFIIKKSLDDVFLNDTIVDEYYTKDNVEITWSSNITSCYIDGEEITTSYTLSHEGDYVLIIRDLAGNFKEIQISIDRTPPTIDQSLEGLKTNVSMKITWTETNCTATLNGVPYTRGTTIYSSGTYEFTITDKAGNSYTATFVIQTSLTPFIITEVDADGNETVLDSIPSSTYNKIVFTNFDGLVLTLNDVTYEDTRIEFVHIGTYNLTITDEFGNRLTHTLRITDIPKEALPNYVKNNIIVFSLLVTSLGAGIFVLVLKTKNKNKNPLSPK